VLVYIETYTLADYITDVSHGAKELNLHKRWSRRITEEFFYQGDKEREYNIPVTPLCDRTGNISKVKLYACYKKLKFV